MDKLPIHSLCVILTHAYSNLIVRKLNRMKRWPSPALTSSQSISFLVLDRLPKASPLIKPAYPSQVILNTSLKILSFCSLSIYSLAALSSHLAVLAFSSSLYSFFSNLLMESQYLLYSLFKSSTFCFNSLIILSFVSSLFLS